MCWVDWFCEFLEDLLFRVWRCVGLIGVVGF
jgi:hypothetical protein